MERVQPVLVAGADATEALWMEGLNPRQLALLRHALSHPGFRYSVLSHQNSHGVSHQTARSDLQKLAASGLLTAGKDGRPQLFRMPEDLAMRLPG